MNRNRPKPITVEGKKLIPRLLAAKQIGVSPTSIDKYVFLGIIEKQNYGGFRYIVESSLAALETRIPVQWGNAEWTSPEGKKYVPVTKAASMLGVGNSTAWGWANTGTAPFGFELDVVKLGVTRPRLFIAEDSLLAFDHLRKMVEGPNKAFTSLAKPQSKTKTKQTTQVFQRQKPSKPRGK